MLSESQKQFIFKRSLFHKISGYLVWSIGLSTAAAWCVMWWLKPTMVNPQAVLDLLKTKKDAGIELSPVTDIALLAVTGSTAVSAFFVILLVLVFFMRNWNKKEHQYLEIIEHLQKQD